MDLVLMSNANLTNSLNLLKSNLPSPSINQSQFIRSMRTHNLLACSTLRSLQNVTHGTPKTISKVPSEVHSEVHSEVLTIISLSVVHNLSVVNLSAVNLSVDNLSVSQESLTNSLVSVALLHRSNAKTLDFRTSDNHRVSRNLRLISNSFVAMTDHNRSLNRSLNLNPNMYKNPATDSSKESVSRST